MADSLEPITGEKLRCPNCGAVNPTAAPTTDVLKCWLCTEPFHRDAAKMTDETEPDQQTLLEKQGMTFGLTTVMLVVTLAAVGFGVFRNNPAIGVLFFIFVTPALIRTQVIAMRRQRSGVPVTALQRLELFMVSFSATFGIVIALTVAAAIALLGTCIILISQF